MKRRRKARKTQRAGKLKQLIILLIITVLFAAMINRHVVAATEPADYKYYTHIVVQEGDSLWDIAGKYMGQDYKTRKAYIKEVCRINHMSTDRVYTGTTLIVPYYESAKK